MNTANLNTLIQRYEDNFEWINNAEHDEIFKWRAVRCFQDVWFSEEVEDMTFAEKFKAATKECSVLLDNGQVSPTNGIVKMAEQEPDEVERLFVEVLFADDQGNLQLRQDHVEEFLDGIEAVRERTFPSYWKYGRTVIVPSPIWHSMPRKRTIFTNTVKPRSLQNISSTELILAQGKPLS